MRAFVLASFVALVACGPDKPSGNGSTGGTGGDSPDGGSGKQSYSLTVQVAGNGRGRIVSRPAGIDCPTTCSASFAGGTGVSLEATSDPLSRFGAFGGSCSGPSCTVPMTSDATVSGTFELRRYAVINLGRPPDAGIFCSATAISPNGQYIAGNFGRAGGAFFWDGAMRTAVARASARGVNDSGIVVGHQEVANGHAFRWRAGVTTDLGTLGGAGSWASNVNRNGIVVGSAARSDGQMRAVSWNATGITDLGSLGNGARACSGASGINSDGIIVGESCRDAAGNHAVRFRSPGVIEDLGTLGGASSSALAINDAGIIVGTSDIDGSGASHGFYYSNGRMLDAGTLAGMTSSDLRALNSDGVAVGSAQSGSPITVRAVAFANGRLVDLTQLLDDTTYSGIVPSGIDDGGNIAASGWKDEVLHPLALRPH